MTEVNLNYLKAHITTKEHCYNIVSQVYFLPNKKSKCITKNYLYNMVDDKSKIFKIEREKVKIPPPIIGKHYLTKELFDILEEILKKKNLPSSGFTVDSLPDINWIKSVIYALDGNNSIFQKSDIKNEGNFKMLVDEK